MRWLSASLVVLSSVASVASTASTAAAQVIYAPPITRYCGNGNSYDYAGDLPVRHAAAAYPSLPGTVYGRRDGFAYVSPTRVVTERYPRILADHLGPHRNPLTDLTVADVVNARLARLPRYFTKAGLIAAQHASGMESDGGRSSGSVVIIMHGRRTGGPTTRPVG